MNLSTVRCIILRALVTYFEAWRVRKVCLWTLRVVEGSVPDGTPRRPEGEAAAVEEVPAPVPIFGRLIYYLQIKYTVDTRGGLTICT